MNNIIFKKSSSKSKKYTAILPDGKKIHFGAAGYQHYRDDTPLKLYSNLNHLDSKRRDLYYKRHNIDYPFPSADFFSKRFLWPKK